MRVLRLGVIAFVSILFIVAPVSAQQAQSVPGIGDITPAGELVVAGAVIVAIVTGTFTLLTKYVDNKFADDKGERDDAKAKIENLTALTQVVTMLVQNMDKQNTASNADRKTLLEIVETKELADERHKDGVAKINEHTSGEAEGIGKKVDELDKKLDGVIKTLEEVHSAAVLQEVVQGAMNPLVLKIEAAIQDMRAMRGDSSPSLTIVKDAPPTP